MTQAILDSLILGQKVPLESWASDNLDVSDELNRDVEYSLVVS